MFWFYPTTANRPPGRPVGPYEVLMFAIPFTLHRSIAITRSPGDVYDFVADFATWPQWSPWLCQEPECPVTITGTQGTVGHKQAWNGKVIGSGEMTMSEAQAPGSLEYNLLFLKPWKTRSRVVFQFAPEGEGTVVTWWMYGSLPFFMFFMRKMMDAWVGGDYKRGLAMMKEVLEKGSVPTRTRIVGVESRDAFHFVGRRRTCAMDDIGPAMQEDLKQLCTLEQAGKLPSPEKVLSVYHKFNMVKGETEYTTGYLYRAPVAAPEGLAAGQMPAHRALRVEHLGAYRHLGNAWAAAMGCARGQHKMNRRLPMYEIYVNDPNEVPETETVAEIYIPVK
jgi:effector-binding domain-containing protein